jgi:fructose-1,6-bisphosphatase I
VVVFNIFMLRIKPVMNDLTLNNFLQKDVNLSAHPALPEMIADVALACKQIALLVRSGALTDSMGSLATQNIQGETQKQLDVLSNDVFIQCNQAHGHYMGMASEELEAPYEIPQVMRQHGRYLLLFDPLDGSSNVNVNISVGTIFSILESPSTDGNSKLEDYLQSGAKQVCAGYALYGTSTMLVITTGNGVNGFTLNECLGDVTAGEFILTHPAMQIAADSSEFAINMSNQNGWDAPVQRYIDECIQGESGVRGKAFNMRWVASMVAEIHRVLIRGGVFLYPVDAKNKGVGGKLRLLYEANPMSFIVEQAGGAASTGWMRVMDVVPQTLHQRIPVVMGSKHEVEQVAVYYQALDVA